MRILAADDHPLYRDAMARLIARVFDAATVIEADTYDAVLNLLAVDREFDLLLVDLRMPGGDSYEMLRHLHLDHPQLPIVVVSAAEHAWDVRRAMHAGAVGFISKSASEQQMCESLERTLRGDAPLEELPASGSRPQSDRVHASGENAELTPRQRQVLELICAGESNKRIARRLGLTVGTVKLHVCAILQALDVESRTQAAVKAHNMGYAPPAMD